VHRKRHARVRYVFSDQLMVLGRSGTADRKSSIAGLFVCEEQLDILRI